MSTPPHGLNRITSTVSLQLDIMSKMCKTTPNLSDYWKMKSINETHGWHMQWIPQRRPGAVCSQQLGSVRASVYSTFTARACGRGFVAPLSADDILLCLHKKTVLLWTFDPGEPPGGAGAYLLEDGRSAASTALMHRAT